MNGISRCTRAGSTGFFAITRPADGSSKGAMTDAVCGECFRGRHSASSKALRFLKSWQPPAPDSRCRRAAVLDRHGVYGSPLFHLAAKKAKIRAHIGAEITCTDGVRYPLARGKIAGVIRALPADHPDEAAGEKGRRRGYAGGMLEEFAGGLICFASATNPARRETILRTFGKRNVYSGLQRHFQRAEERRNQAVTDSCAPAGYSAGFVKRRLKHHSEATRGAGRAHVCPQQGSCFEHCTAAVAKRRASLEDTCRDHTPAFADIP